MKPRGNDLTMGFGMGMWSAPYPGTKGNQRAQASLYRVLCLSSDGMSKLQAIRKALRAATKLDGTASRG